MTNPLKLLDQLHNSITEWQEFGERAQLEAVMPVLDVLIAHKVTYKRLAEILASAGLKISTDALRQALSRWRRKHAIGGTARSGAGDRAATLAVPNSAGTERVIDRSMRLSSEVDKNAGTPLTKTRLQEIKEEHIDLEALAKLARS